MQRASRPFMTAGIALVGASAIAVSPLAPPPITQSATSTVSTAVVQLAATSFVDPITRWKQVIDASAANLAEINAYMMKYPERSLPGLLEMLEAKGRGYYHELFDGLPSVARELQAWATVTMPSGLRTALEQLAAGEPEAATKTVYSSVMSLIGFPLFGAMGFITVPVKIMQDIVDITRGIAAPFQLISILRPALDLAWSPFLSLGTTAQRVIDSLQAGDVLSAVGAVLNAPADAVDHFLNAPGGLIEIRLFRSIAVGGLMTQLLIRIPDAIKGNLKPPTIAARTAATLDSTDIGSRQLTSASDPEAEPSTASEVKSDAAAADPTTSAGVEDVSAIKEATSARAAVRPIQRVNTSLQNSTDQTDNNDKGIRSDIAKSLKKVNESISKVGTRKGIASGKPRDSRTADSSGSDD